MVLGLLLLAGSFAASVILTKAAIIYYTGKGFLAHPSSDRYHSRPVALGGGSAIFATIILFIVGSVVFALLFVFPDPFNIFGEEIGSHYEGFSASLDQLCVVIGCAAVLYVVGYIDDRKGLGPFFKLAVQFGVAFAGAWFANIKLELFIHNRFITSVISTFWIVLIINCFNFLDNMDGLSAGIALIVSTVLFTAAAVSGQFFIGSISLVTMGALAGFLVFNFPPAKVFMGDAGSMVVGFFLALISLRTTYYNQSLGSGLYAVFMPIIVMAVPFYDFVTVTLIRLWQGKSPFVGDTQHFSHRLKRRGLTDRQVALTLYLATICTSISAVFLYQVNLAGTILVFAQTIMVLAIIATLEWSGGKG